MWNEIFFTQLFTVVVLLTLLMDMATLMRHRRELRNLVASDRSRAVPLLTVEKKKARDAFASHAPENSRGGTRTRDPGIMSAVL